MEERQGRPPVHALALPPEHLQAAPHHQRPMRINPIPHRGPEDLPAAVGRGCGCGCRTETPLGCMLPPSSQPRPQQMGVCNDLYGGNFCLTF